MTNYILQYSDGTIKIGYTLDLEERLAGLRRTDAPFTIYHKFNADDRRRAENLIRWWLISCECKNLPHRKDYFSAVKPIILEIIKSIDRYKDEHFWTKQNHKLKLKLKRLLPVENCWKDKDDWYRQFTRKEPIRLKKIDN